MSIETIAVCLFLLKPVFISLLILISCSVVLLSLLNPNCSGTITFGALLRLPFFDIKCFQNFYQAPVTGIGLFLVSTFFCRQLFSTVNMTTSVASSMVAACHLSTFVGQRFLRHTLTLIIHIHFVLFITHVCSLRSGMHDYIFVMVE